MTTADTTTPSPRSLWSDLPRRVGTIIIGFPIVVILLLQCPLLFFQGVHAICAMEYAKLSLVLVPSSAAAAAAAAAATTTKSPWPFVLVSMMVAQLGIQSNDELILPILVSGFVLLFFWNGPHSTLQNQHQHHDTQGILAVTFPMTIWYKVATTQSTPHVISLLLICWNCDTGALLVGRMIQMTLIPSYQPQWLRQISPTKSIAGMIGGIGLGTTTVVLLPLLWTICGINNQQQWWNKPNGIHHGIVLALLSIVGDLMESAIKRQSNQKDSSALLPGHGGILDRFDSTLLAVIYYYYYMRGNIAMEV